jgi:DNA-binding Lrp family transcriptional regulator
MALDAMDRRLLDVLQRRGRISNADLAEAVNLSASACHRRVQRLEAEGYIRDYVALLDARKLGMPATIFVEITLSTQADDVLEAFEKAVARIPDVLAPDSGGRRLHPEGRRRKYRGFRAYTPPTPDTPPECREDAIQLCLANGFQDNRPARLIRPPH